ncbi:conserved hypothetical protein [Talaromyces stipitatus ATCC 10500]|uniref:Uncharacterized protein n=1 Tax=Talaromyces stipitatus (strain ATCC 10500 / CBS 375.48 / QM 6759 / NRRL 1006) TaxID=441959 RepID=B8LXU3_TALSN|nr:uncharacterized protein TSTA_062450 [Talaromyces stipitatus ATCC 10500]EED22758.1 conserved hypothetical protein [Talaromyces stipitatus ATCC 10500]
MALFVVLLSLLLTGIYCLEETVYNAPNRNVDSQDRTWEQTPWYAPTPGNIEHERTPSVYSSSPNHRHNEPLTSSRRPTLSQLGFLNEDDCFGGGAHDAYASCINYVIKWKVKLNNRGLARDTEQDLSLKPSSYWQQIKEKAERVLRQKKPRNHRVRLDDIEIVMSINDRSHRDLTKRFEKDSNEPRIDKRNSSSTTKRMLNEREDRMDAEDFAGQPSVWRNVYKTMRCPGPPCHHEGQYCWQDPIGKKHYRLRTHHLKTLIKYIEQGGIIETHDDIPDSVRDQLYAEEQQRAEKQQRSSGLSTSAAVLPPININVLLTPQHSVSTANDMEVTLRSTPTEVIDIPGPLEAALEEYTEWQLSRVETEQFIHNIKKARDIAFENCLDLKQICTDKNPGYFYEQGVKIGAARRFVNDVLLWIEDRKQKELIAARDIWD